MKESQCLRQGRHLFLFIFFSYIFFLPKYPAFVKTGWLFKCTTNKSHDYKLMNFSNIHTFILFQKCLLFTEYQVPHFFSHFRYKGYPQTHKAL